MWRTMQWDNLELLLPPCRWYSYCWKRSMSHTDYMICPHASSYGVPLIFRNNYLIWRYINCCHLSSKCIPLTVVQQTHYSLSEKEWRISMQRVREIRNTNRNSSPSVWLVVSMYLVLFSSSTLRKRLRFSAHTTKNIIIVCNRLLNTVWSGWFCTHTLAINYLILFIDKECT